MLFSAAACCTLTLHAACCSLFAADDRRCMLHAACCMLTADCCMLTAAC
jgi:hypothetical protein